MMSLSVFAGSTVNRPDQTVNMGRKTHYGYRAIMVSEMIRLVGFGTVAI